MGEGGSTSILNTNRRVSPRLKFEKLNGMEKVRFRERIVAVASLVEREGATRHRRCTFFLRTRARFTFLFLLATVANDRFRHTYPLETRTKGYLPIEFHSTFFLTIMFCNKLDLHTHTYTHKYTLVYE